MFEQFKNPTLAICYDFDKTLSPKNMQEYEFMKDLNIDTKKFWEGAQKITDKHQADNILTYMYYMIKASEKSGMHLNKGKLSAYGKTIELFSGLDNWFNRINEFGKKNGVKIRHYIISSGLKKIIEGTPIAKHFDEIFACEFIYDEKERPIWPSSAINYTTKTQFLYRINKGFTDITDNFSVNQSMPKENRPIPFSNIVYIGDSSTDIPSMRLTVKNGGYAIGVYNPKNQSPSNELLDLVKRNRINFYAPANYNDNSMLNEIMKKIIMEVKFYNQLKYQTLKQQNKN